MLDVMLIDDDKIVRDYLKDTIEWETLQLRPVCEAGDGLTARELYDRHHPKIVIADINIPFTTGLELARQFVQDDPTVRVIIITGYGDFDNVRQSISAGAIDLLSKPINPVEINASLRRAVEDFHRLQQYYRTNQVLTDLLKDNRPLLQERCVAQLLNHAPESGEEALHRQLELLGLSFPCKYFAAVQIRLENDAAEALSGAMFPTAFKKLCDTAFAANGVRAFTYYAEHYVLSCMTGWDAEDGDNSLEDLLTKLLEDTRFYFQAGFSASIGNPVTRLAQLHISAQQAQLAAKFGDEDSRGVISYRNVSRLAALPPTYDRQLNTLLLENARGLRREEFSRLLGEAVEQLTPDALRELSSELLSELASICFQAGLHPWDAVNYPNTVAGIFGAAGGEEIRQILGEACGVLMDLLYEQRTQSKNQLVHLAKAYICQHLSDPNLSLDMVSAHVGLSKIYFCQLFSREEEISFNTYLNGERIALAQTLLRTSNKKVFEISTEVGYSSPKYFNYVFKHTVGQTPMEYRNEYLGKNS